MRNPYLYSPSRFRFAFALRHRAGVHQRQWDNNHVYRPSLAPLRVLNSRTWLRFYFRFLYFKLACGLLDSAFNMEDSASPFLDIVRVVIVTGKTDLLAWLSHAGSLL